MTRRAAATSARQRPTQHGSDWRSAGVFIFDVEGTLVDAMMPTLRCWRETLQSFGYDLSLAELHQLSGMDGAEMLKQLLPDTVKTMRQEILDLHGKRFREDFLPHIPAFPGVRALFEELKQRDRRIALATDCAKDQLKHYLAIANIEDLIDAIACGDDVRHGKPAPSVVEIALRRVRAGQKRCVLVGDTPFDAQAARKTGIEAVGVLTGHFSERALREAGCRAVLRDPTALRRAMSSAAIEFKYARAPAA